jgi:hypothetical protein
MTISLNKLENIIEDWLKPIPHLPNIWRQLISNNVWWLVVIVVVGSSIGILELINEIINITPYPMMELYNDHYIYRYSNEWHVLALTIDLLFSIAITAVSAMAIQPLRNRERRGWSLLFIAYIIGIASQVTSILICFGILSFIPRVILSAISAVVGAYLLFEIRTHFNTLTISSNKK